MFGKKKKKSFLEKLTGSVHAEDLDDDFVMEDEMDEINQDRNNFKSDYEEDGRHLQLQEDDGDGQLSVDVFNTDDAIIIKAMTAGVKPGDLDIDISRDMVTIRGVREETHEIAETDYYHKELYWGSFSRNIFLPEEIDVDESEAVEKHGLITLTLPKLDKTRKTKLQVKSK